MSVFEPAVNPQIRRVRRHASGLARTPPRADIPGMLPNDSDEQIELIRKRLRAAGLMPHLDAPDAGKAIVPAGRKMRRASVARFLAGFLVQAVLLLALSVAALLVLGRGA